MKRLIMYFHLKIYYEAWTIHIFLINSLSVKVTLI